MIQGRLRRHILRVIMSLLLLSVVVSSCTLSPQQEQTIDLTDVPTNTPQPTRTPADQVGILPTALPTLTSAPLPTAIPLVNPTQVALLPPTAAPLPTNTSLPISIVLLSPVPGSVVAGNVQILGAATHPQFLQYQLEYGTDPNPGNLWYPTTGVIQTPVINGLLGIWNTTTVNDGLYQIRLRVTLRDGTSLATVVNNIRVQNQQPTPVPTATTIPRPIAAFSQSTTVGQVPLVVNFFNQSQGEITNYSWSFGDGGNSSEINPTYTFRNPGVYTVMLTASGPGGSSNVSRQISVQTQDPPVAAFTQDRTSGETPLVVQFTDQSQGNITSREWQFGDGSQSNERNPSHTFVDVGTYNVFLRVEGPGGSSSVTRQITVENPSVPAPDATFTTSTLEGEAPLTVDFNITNDTNINTYAWDFGGSGTSFESSPQFTFNSAGTYTVELVVTGDGGQDSAQVQINVLQPPDAPIVTISANPESGNIPLTVQFQSNSTGGAITSYSWNFGDGVGSSTEANPQYTYQSEGSFNVQLDVTGPGGTDSETITVNAIQPIAEPVADFSVDITDINNRTIAVTNLSTGEGLSYSWNFGDGVGTSTESSPQYSYGDWGTYLIQLSVSNSAGTSTISKEITLNEPAPSYTPVTAVASANPTSGDAPLTVQFDSSASTGDIASYSWDFGDGVGTSADANPQYVYNAAGQYIATLTLTGQDGSTSSAQVVITAQTPAPSYTPVTAVASANPTSGDAPLTVQFDSSASTDDIASYSWDFGDGVGTSADANPQYVYNAAGQYTATLTLTGQDGSTSSAQVVITAQTPAPSYTPVTAVASANPTSGDAPLTVQFDSSTSTGDIASYSWDFGDGVGTSADANPQYVYNAAGQYTATLTLTGQDGSTSSAQVVVTAQTPAPSYTPVTAVASANPTSGDAPLTVQFDSSTSTGDIASYSWDFGDGVGTSADANPQYVYNAAGQYTATLTLTGQDGSTSSAQVAVTANQTLTASFTATPLTGTAPLTVQFDSSASTGDISTFSWDFGDSAGFSNEPNPQYVYNNAGQYTVTLTVTSLGGVTSQAQQMVTVEAGAPILPPIIVFASERDGVRQVYTMAEDGSNVTRITDIGSVAEGADWSQSNEFVFTIDNTLYLMNADGSNVQMLGTGVAGLQPAWAPNNSQIAFVSEQDGNREVYVINRDGSGLINLTNNPTTDEQPAWSPDGSRVLFTSDRDGNRELYVMNADGSNVMRLTDNPATDEQPAWSPDGSRILFTSDRDGNRELYVMNADGSNVVRLTDNPATDEQPAWSPDGSRVLFTSDRDGNRELYVMNADGSNVVRLTDNLATDEQPIFKPTP